MATQSTMRLALWLLAAGAPSALAKSKGDVPCVWKSLTGAEFDLRSLTVSGKQSSYYIKDGDIPCTPEIEPTYSFVWNFCGQVTEQSFPSVCDPDNQQAAALQYINRADGFTECEVIGHYDSSRDDLYYSLIDVSDPSKGVSMKYPDGSKCVPSNKLRSVTLDVLCENTELEIVSALEPTSCDYHVVMKSYRGCPKVTIIANLFEIDLFIISCFLIIKSIIACILDLPRDQERSVQLPRPLLF
jgi:hypothetical protein